MGFSVKYFDQLLEDMIAWIIAHSSKLTDTSPGSVLRTFCEATSVSIEELYVATFLGFRRQLDEIKSNVFSFERKTGTKSTGEVVFSRTGTSGKVTIPIGTKVATPVGLRFETTEEGTIPDGGSSSSAVEIIAEKVGTEYNVGADTITVMETPVNGVESVTNPNPTTGGVDQEGDYSYHSRFQNYIEGLGRSNIAGLLAGALSVEGITSASIKENFPPISNVNAYLYIDDGSPGGVSTEKISEVQEVIDGDGTESKPGYRGAGINIEVASPSIVTQDVTMTITVEQGVDIDSVKQDIKTNITNYINNLGIGDDIIFNELVSKTMEVFGVTDVSITLPTGNVLITDSQVGRVGTITIST